jgi:HrpA-like RNA helicase
LGKWLKKDPIPVLFIPGRVFPVDEYFRDDYEGIVRAFKGCIYKNNYQNNDDDDDHDSNFGKYGQASSSSSSSSSSFSIGGPQRKGDIDYDLLSKLILMLSTDNDVCRTSYHPITDDNNDNNDDNSSNSRHNYKHMFAIASGTILVFMPGVYEINKLCKLLEIHSKMTTKQLKLIPLHGNLSSIEQKKIFQSVDKHIIKVIISTNVAEASITIPDVSIVIDTCKVKEITYDVELQANNLITKFASQDSLRQRKGRAGRVSKGRCFRLITKNTFNKQSQHSIPEILRVSLTSIILQVKSMLMHLVDNTTTAITATSTMNSTSTTTTTTSMRSSMKTNASTNFSSNTGSIISSNSNINNNTNHNNTPRTDHYLISKSSLYQDIISSMNSINLLKLCVDIPSITSINTAEQLLIQIQALDEGSGRLTSLGQHLTFIPCEPRIGKLLIYGSLFGCVFPASCIAAYMMLRSPFMTLSDNNSNQTIASVKVHSHGHPLLHSSIHPLIHSLIHLSIYPSIHL